MQAVPLVVPKTPARSANRALLRLDELCEFAPDHGEQAERIFWFAQLLAWLRAVPERRGRNPRITFLRAQLETHPEWRARVSRTLSLLVAASDVEDVLVHGGIWRDFHFVGAVREWLEHRLLPQACDTTAGDEILALATREPDVRWLQQAETAMLLRELVEPELWPSLRGQVAGAIDALGHQIVALAQSPAVRSLATSRRSAFRGLSESLRRFLSAEAQHSDTRGALGRVQECLRELEAHRDELLSRGADLNTTFQLSHVRQQLLRLRDLLAVYGDARPRKLAACLAWLVKSVHRNSGGRHLFKRSSDLVLQNLVEGAASVGQNYLREEHSSLLPAFKAGVGGGAIMALATILKYALLRLRLPDVYQGLVFSLNYAAAFCAAYLLHFTIATKLPAHTAAALAQTARKAVGHRARVGAFLELWRATLRLQVAGLVGNLVAAAPLAFALDHAWRRLTGAHFLDRHAAEHVIESSSLLGPSVIYAALTGVFLWLSSLLGATASNWSRVVRLEDRFATSMRTMATLGPTRARAAARAFVSRLGGMVGNVSLGFLLGCVPAFFAVLRLPVDIRHVTVSAASLSLSLATQLPGTSSELWLALLGVVAIGIVNVGVSFALALWLAVRFAAGRHGASSALPLMRVAVGRWLRRAA